LDNKLEAGDDIALTSITASTSTATGALTIAGGVGIAGAVYFGSDLSWNPVNIPANSIPANAVIEAGGSFIKQF